MATYDAFVEGTLGTEYGSSYLSAERSTFGGFLIGGGGVSSDPSLPPAELMAKTQFLASEPLKIVFMPFFDTATGAYIVAGLDVVTLTVKDPSGVLMAPAPTPVFDSDTNFWVAEVDVTDYEEGDWKIKAVSDAAGTLPQYRLLTWGDYWTDIHQASMGRWKIEGTQLKIFADDGVTVVRTFDLKDADGNPSATRVFERDPA